MEIEIDDRVALVTGAGRGNGAAIARELAANGATVVVNDLEAEPAESTAESIREDGGDAIAVAADVSDADAVESMVAEATDEVGTVDSW